MFYVLVMFKGASAPVVFGTSHTSHAAKLATMDGVEWVSNTIANGTTFGDVGHSMFGEGKILGFKGKEES